MEELPLTPLNTSLTRGKQQSYFNELVVRIAREHVKDLDQQGKLSASQPNFRSDPGLNCSKNETEESNRLNT